MTHYGRFYGGNQRRQAGTVRVWHCRGHNPEKNITNMLPGGFFRKNGVFVYYGG
jgi:hypothetical protein